MTNHLLCRLGSYRCALPLGHVLETMRPLPVEPLAGAPDFVTGLAVIRGLPTPVVDLARLLNEQTGQPGRFVSLRVHDRQVAVAVDEVEGIFPLQPSAQLPPLLSQARPQAISAMGQLDSHLLLVLQTGSLVPPSVWEQLQ